MPGCLAGKGAFCLVSFDMEVEAVSLNANMLAEFEASFSQIHQSFFENLQKDFPRLTHAEKRLCAFIRLNLSTKEIAMVMNQDPNSVRIARVRLRRKLGLTSKSESLSEFLSRY